MTILIFGANGQVGWACQEEAKLRNISTKTLNRKDVDLCVPDDAYKAIINNTPSIVINAAAYTAVDKAESEADKAELINAHSPARMATACEELEIPLIHLSTDYVFDGKASVPYKEEDNTNPQGVYGRTKLLGEKAILENCTRSLILRTSWVFGIHGNNFVKTMLRLGKERDQLGVVADQEGCPTFAGHIAEAIFDLVNLYQTKGNVPSGIYNLTDKKTTTWYGFATSIFSKATSEHLLEKAPVVTAITTEAYPTPAQRPAYSVLECQKLESLINRPMRNWVDGLKKFMDEYK